MPLLTRIVGGVVGLLRRTRQDQGLDAELQEFLEMAIEDKVRAGMSREAATRAARIELGSAAAVKDRVRDVGWENVFETTWQDVRYAARTLRRSPGFTAVAVISLALGIGANTAIFSLINTLMLRQLPVRNPEQLVQVLSRYPGEPRMSSFSWRHYEHFRDHNQSFSDLLAVSRARVQVSGDGLEPETIDGEYVAGNFFTALGVQAALGRVIDARDDQVDSASATSAVVSWSYWTNRLHADPTVPGEGVEESLANLIFASWNHVRESLRRLEALRQTAWQRASDAAQPPPPRFCRPLLEHRHSVGQRSVSREFQRGIADGASRVASKHTPHDQMSSGCEELTGLCAIVRSAPLVSTLHDVTHPAGAPNRVRVELALFREQSVAERVLV